jgi:hypothetical protein
MKLLYMTLAGVALWSGVAFAQNTQVQTPSCSCSCFDGRPLAVCGGPQDGFVCTADVCPPKPSITPLPQEPPSIPKPTDQVCKMVLGINPANGQNEFKTVCK